MTGLQDAGPLRILIAPGRYVQGPGALGLLAGQLEVLGIKHPMAMGGPTAIDQTREFIDGSCGEKGMSVYWEEFGRECTYDEVARMAEICVSEECDAILSIGGGKAIDCGKAAATDVAIDIGVVPAKRMNEFPEEKLVDYKLSGKLSKFGAGVPKIVIPTIAATDAPCSALTVMYSAEHVYQTFLVYPINPTMVVPDTAIIAKAPARFLVSGMGDALATWFEADMTFRTNGVNMPGGSPPMTALAIGRLCYETLRRYGVQAKLAVLRNAVTPAVEKIVEANILLSGLGFESGGLSAAHGTHNGFTVLEHKMKDLPGPPKHGPYHGELVAFGTLVEMVLEDRDTEFIKSVMMFCKTVGLPTCLKEIGLPGLGENDIEAAAIACSKDVLYSTMARAYPNPVDGSFYPWKDIAYAIKAVDAIGEAYPNITAPDVVGLKSVSTPGSY
jgi:glycerol dehydrogenase